MPALAGNGRTIAHALAVGAAILAPLRYRAFTSWMGTFVGFLFGHDLSPSTGATLQPEVSFGASLL